MKPGALFGQSGCELGPAPGRPGQGTVTQSFTVWPNPSVKGTSRKRAAPYVER
jgi:hypothetical protein